MTSRFSRANLKALSSICMLIACLTLACWTTGVRAQGFDATSLRQPTEIDDGWRIHAGDDPAYARPELDDSHWIPFKPARESSETLRTKLPNSQPAIVWYRVHVKLAPDQHDLSLHTTDLPAPWEVYVNGVRLARACSFSPYVACHDGAHTLIPIPDKLLAGGSLVVALRIYIAPVEWKVAPRPGFQAHELTFGPLKVMREHMWYWIAGGNEITLLYDLIDWGLMLGGLMLYLAQRNRKEYLWLFLMIAVGVPAQLLYLYADFHTFPSYWSLITDVPDILWPYFMARMYCAFAGHRIGWKLNLFLILTLVCMTCFIGGQFFGVYFFNFQLVNHVPIALLGVVVLPSILIADIRRGRRETILLLVPVLLEGVWIAVYTALAMLLQFPGLRDKVAPLFTHWISVHFGAFSIRFNTVADALAMLSLALIILIRSSQMSRQQALLESEMAHAREVQKVILPEAMSSIPGFHIESIYEPAREVGGDFFQVLDAPNDSLILVIGDVAGKGLPAAMLVSVLVGAVRTAAQYDPSPEGILGQLNAHLVGRTNGGFATALAAHITAEGTVTIANAGHLSPYLDGKELELPGALPLGIVGGITYEVARIDLTPGSRLTFYSDGVVEAQDKRGQLLGFERAQELSMQPAAAIAEAAKAFGQEDDITVITVERLAASRSCEVELTSAALAPA